MLDRRAREAHTPTTGGITSAEASGQTEPDASRGPRPESGAPPAPEYAAAPGLATRGERETDQLAGDPLNGTAESDGAANILLLGTDGQLLVAELWTRGGSPIMRLAVYGDVAEFQADADAVPVVVVDVALWRAAPLTGALLGTLHRFAATDDRITVQLAGAAL